MALHNSDSLTSQYPTDGRREETTEDLTTFETEYENRSLILEAIFEGNVIKIKELLEYVDVHSVDENGDSLLYFAVGCGNVDCVKALLDHGAQASATNCENQTPLHKALLSKADVQIVTELLLHGADPSASDEDGNTPLHLGFDYGVTLQCVQELLKYDVGINSGNWVYETPLHKALLSKTGLPIILEILKHGADPNIPKCNNETPLHTALLWYKDVDVVQALLEHGADVNIIDSLGRTPLYLAIDHVPLAMLLIKYMLVHGAVDEPSNPLNYDVCNYLGQFNFVKDYVEECILEVLKMKTMKVNDRLPLYDFVNSDSNIPLYFDDVRAQFVTQEEQLFVNYPMYEDIILRKVEGVLERGMLLRKLSEVLVYSRNHLGLSKNVGDKVALNYDCASIMTKFLSNVDLCNLMLAYNCNKKNSECDSPDTGIRQSKSEKRFLDSSTSPCTKRATLEYPILHCNY